ncbi:hypothetical protein [Pseudomonas oryzihabitans]|uniref:hypothetical protein n=1 Tax=Pseudomonas oryzihabitans TaxID=47885 RepID=UPI002858470E|nr:hypothetical protein [Pseudomonas psychrotolerans]MDR6680190.1 hypothetical protein [Pseudomonas psychrotolerans]
MQLVLSIGIALQGLDQRLAIQRGDYHVTWYCFARSSDDQQVVGEDAQPIMLSPVARTM